METPIGEIKRIRDFFEHIKFEDDDNPDPALRTKTEFVKCKICNDEISGYSTLGMFSSNMISIEDRMDWHIELHKTMKLLNL